ncbi:hypothetical protein RclHR1_36080002 [Rhizophagus clarus]|uniref:Uncharacterized protein n=1 Tax=Rhizophagus clarus TaxID=94130 RepID=A0A2Z6RNC7_9GLOM|nr:hypothetical protein RclHR1_36080002 [Rhizophagus clarus]
MPVYKLFLDLYYDDFGTFRNVYHSLGGVYVQFGNMPTHQRKLIKNHFVLEFIPFGGNFDEFMLPFVSEMKELEKAVLPQGNDLVEVLRHNANKGCHTCTIKKELWSFYNQDTVTILHYHHITNEEILEISQELFLKESSLKHNEAVAIQQRIDAFQINLVPKSIIFCWVYIAKTMKTVFNKEFMSDSYKELQQYLEEEFQFF